MSLDDPNEKKKRREEEKERRKSEKSGGDPDYQNDDTGVLRMARGGRKTGIYGIWR